MATLFIRKAQSGPEEKNKRDSQYEVSPDVIQRSTSNWESLVSRLLLKEIFHNNLTDDEKIQVEIIICKFGNRVVFEKEIKPVFTMLDLLRFLIQKDSNYNESSFHFGLTKELITIKNSTSKLVDFVDEKNVIKLFEVGMFTPKNDLLRAKNIVKIYDNCLQNTSNIHDVCCINHAKIGESNGFGKGSPNVPVEVNNTLKNIVFVKYQKTSAAYNRYCLLMMIDPTSRSFLIPHLNLRVNLGDFIKKLNSSIETGDGFMIVHIDDIINSET